MMKKYDDYDFKDDDNYVDDDDYDFDAEYSDEKYDDDFDDKSTMMTMRMILMMKMAFVEDEITAFSTMMTAVVGDDTDAACDGVAADSYSDSGDDSQKPVNVRSPSSSPPPLRTV